MPIRIIIADDHPVVRLGLRMTIEECNQDIVVVGEASDGREVLKLAGTVPADVFILDITMPYINGIETARALHKKFPAVKVIMLSLHGTKFMVEEALAVGARGYLTKEFAVQYLVHAVTEVSAGRYFICPSVAHFVVEAGRLAGKKGPRKRETEVGVLTAKENRVLQLIAEGQSNKEIASDLELSSHTIHTHRQKLMEKLNIHKQGELVRYAIKAGIAKL